MCQFVRDFQAAGLALSPSEWTDEEAFTAYGLDEATITALRAWAVSSKSPVTHLRGLLLDGRRKSIQPMAERLPERLCTRQSLTTLKEPQPQDRTSCPSTTAKNNSLLANGT